MLPSALKIKDQKKDYNKYDSYVSLNKEKEVLEYIENHHGKKVDILNRLFEEETVLVKEFDRSLVRELEKLELVRIEKVKKYRINRDKKDIKNYKLSKEQEKVFLDIKECFKENKTFLIKGVTGSGKTLIYINLIKEVINNHKTAILLV